MVKLEPGTIIRRIKEKRPEKSHPSRSDYQNVHWGAHETTPVDDDTIIELWDWMDAFYKNCFIKIYGDDAAKWKAELNLAGLSPHHVAFGIQKCRELNETFPPNLSTFIGRCIPTAQDMGLPEPEEAYVMATHNDWTHPIVWHAAQAVDPFLIRTQSAAVMKPRFESKYRSLLRMSAFGHRFTRAEEKDVEVSRIEHYRLSKEQVDAYRKEALRLAGVKRWNKDAHIMQCQER